MPRASNAMTYAECRLSLVKSGIHKNILILIEKKYIVYQLLYSFTITD